MSDLCAVFCYQDSAKEYHLPLHHVPIYDHHAFFRLRLAGKKRKLWEEAGEMQKELLVLKSKQNFSFVETASLKKNGLGEKALLVTPKKKRTNGTGKKLCASGQIF